MGKCDTHIDVKAWWAVANKILPINIRSQQPLGCVRVSCGSYLRHSHQSGATRPPVTVALSCADSNPEASHIRYPLELSGACGLCLGGRGLVTAAPVLMVSGWTAAARLQPHSFAPVTQTVCGPPSTASFQPSAGAGERLYARLGELRMRP